MTRLQDNLKSLYPSSFRIFLSRLQVSRINYMNSPTFPTWKMWSVYNRGIHDVTHLSEWTWCQIAIGCYYFTKKSRGESWDSTTWFRIRKFQNPLKIWCLRMHIMVERFDFWWWWSGWYNIESHDISNGTNVAFDFSKLYLHFFTYIVYAFRG
jgi:hypothetical protein